MHVTLLGAARRDARRIATSGKYANEREAEMPNWSLYKDIFGIALDAPLALVWNGIPRLTSAVRPHGLWVRNPQCSRSQDHQKK